MTEKQAQPEPIPLTLQELRRVKENANKHFFNDAKPNEYEGGDFLTQCYIKGFCELLWSKGIKIDFYVKQERSFQEPIE